MRFCTSCDRVLTRLIDDGKIRYTCYICGDIIDGNLNDVLIHSGTMKANENIMEKYGRLIDNAAYDRVNLQVPKDCERCGLDYMTQVRVGESESVIWVCKCGNLVTPK